MKDWILAACLLIAIASIAQCEWRTTLSNAEVRKAHIQAGQCRDKWGTWSKCK